MIFLFRQAFHALVHRDRAGDSCMGVCKRQTGYLRMADADGKMRIEKCGWKKKIRIAKKVRRKKDKKCGWQQKKTNKQTIKEKNLSFKSLSRG